MNKKEVWKNINGHGGDYKISSWGRVISFRCRKAKVLKGSVFKDGYRYFSLQGKEGPRVESAHALVAEHFLGSKPKGAYVEVHHINKDKLCNHDWNLEYVVRTKYKYKGIYMRGKSICCRIYKNNTCKYLGAFETEELAHEAYMREKNKED